MENCPFCEKDFYINNVTQKYCSECCVWYSLRFREIYAYSFDIDNYFNIVNSDMITKYPYRCVFYIDMQKYFLYSYGGSYIKTIFQTDFNREEMSLSNMRNQIKRLKDLALFILSAMETAAFMRRRNCELFFIICE